MLQSSSETNSYKTRTKIRFPFIFVSKARGKFELIIENSLVNRPLQYVYLKKVVILFGVVVMGETFTKFLMR